MSKFIQCDACSARAYLYCFQEFQNTGVLYFCGSHARKHKSALNSSGWLIGLIDDALESSLQLSPSGRVEAFANSNTDISEWLDDIVDVRLGTE